MRFTLSTFHNAWDNEPTAHASTWGALCRSLSTPRVYHLPWRCSAKGCDGSSRLDVDACPKCGAALTLDKRHLPAWSPARWPQGERRRKHSVVDVSLLVLDHDDGMTLDEIADVWRHWPHVVHTSWSHTEAKCKARVVIPLAAPVTAADWPRVWQWAVERDPRADRSCSDASRLFFTPAIRRSDWPFEARVHDEPTQLCAPDLRTVTPVTVTPRPQGLLPVRPRGETRQFRHALKNEPDARRRLAGLLGARVVGEGDSERAKGAKCPKCGLPSVWWPINPRALHGAACDHRNSCGWTGWLDQLAEGVSL